MSASIKPDPYQVMATRGVNNSGQAKPVDIIHFTGGQSPLYIMGNNASGKLSQMITASEQLEGRIQDQIRNATSDSDKARILSTISASMINATHEFPYECYFRPYVLFGSEYTVIDPTSKVTGTTGGKVTYSIPVYGDLIADTVMETNWSEIYVDPGQLDALPLDVNFDEVFGNITDIEADPITYATVNQALSAMTTTFQAQWVVQDNESPKTYTFVKFEFSQDQKTRTFRTIAFRYWDSLTEKFLAPTSVSTQQLFQAGNYVDFCRWCDFPGEKSVSYAEFQINGNLIDYYNNDSYVYLRQAFLNTNKENSYMNLVGQQTPRTASHPSDGVYQGLKNYTDGLQTPKLSHAATVIYSPLLFWFCTSLQNAFPSASIPYGQRFINITVPQSSQLAEKYPRYKRVTIIKEHTIVSSAAPATVAEIFPHGPGDFATYTIKQYMYMTDVLTTGKMNYPSLVNNSLLMYNIFLPTSIHNIIISKIVYKMFKKRIYATKPLATNSANQTISIVDLKFPVEYIFFGVRLTPIDTSTMSTDLIHYKLEDYCKFSRTVRHVVPNQNFVSDQLYRFLISDNIVDDDRLLPEGFDRRNITTYEDPKIYFQAGGIKAQQVSIWDQQTTNFTNNYLTYKKGDLITSMKDKGIYLVTFTETPGRYQPLGHFDASRSRELDFILVLDKEYLADVADGVIGTTYSAALIFEATVENYLYMANGNAIVKFAA